MRHIGVSFGNRAAPAQAAATVTILFGLTALTGWVFDLRALTSIIPGSVEMKANTAGGMVLAGVALLILSDRTSIAWERVAQGASAAVLLIGLATLAEYLVGRTFGIDEWLVKDQAGAYNVYRGRMSPFTAAAFVAVAAALVMLPYRRLQNLTKYGAAGAILIGATSLLGYLWDAKEIISDRWLPPIALNTAACFAFLGGGILICPRRSSAGFGQRVAALAAVEIRILAGFIIALALLLIGGAYTYRTTVQLAESMQWVAHSQEVRAGVASIYGSLAGAEVALRDYLLTRDEADRDEYRRLTEDVQRRLDRVQALTAENPRQRLNLAELRPIVSDRLAAMAATLTAFADFGLPAARAILAVNRRSGGTQSVRLKTHVIDAEEIRLLTARQHATATVRTTTLFSLLATLAGACGLFVALFRGVQKEMRARRQAEEALRASDRYNRSILDSSPDCVCVLDLDGRVCQMTPHGQRLMDVDDFSVIANREWVKTWKGADRAAAKTALDNARANVDGRFQGFCPTLKGTAKWWDVIVMPMLGADGNPERLLVVSRDISAAKRNENELRESNRFLDSLIENLPLVVVIKDAATLRVVRHNGAFEQLLGFSKNALIGKTAHELFTAEEADSITAKDREALEAGRLLETPEQSMLTSHQGLRTFDTMRVPINGRSGKPQYLMAISVDITARQLTEQAIRELNRALGAKASQLETSNKELESFSYSVSHDLRAPLRAIDGFALMIEEDFSEVLGPEGRRFLTVIRENSRRMGALIDDLLAFSRLGRLPVVTQDVNMESLVREVLEEIFSARDAVPDSDVETRPQIDIGSLPAAKGDRGLLRQVWMNLLSNAVKYSGKKPVPRIRVSGRQSETENLYSVEDNGVGFSMDYVEKLFGVFQRLHRADEFSGTGVGLAIVHRVITRHGGRVSAEGRIDGGALFSFALPKDSP